MLDILDKGVYNTLEVKKILSYYVDKKVTIKYSLGRNKYETYLVTIKNLYNSIFIVEEVGTNKGKKSFSYADIITKTIKIYRIKT